MRLRQMLASARLFALDARSAPLAVRHTPCRALAFAALRAPPACASSGLAGVAGRVAVQTALAHTQSAKRSVAARVSVAPSTPSAEPLTFRDVGLSPELLAAVEALNLKAPTEIQAQVIPEILKGGHVVMASHTGSGKTLAYLLPVVQRLRAHEAQSGTRVRLKRPRAVVLEPTRELAQQVLGVAKSLCHHARFSSALISGGEKVQVQREMLLQPRDVLVGTPGRLKQLLDAGEWYAGDVQFLVVDEADTLFDAGFGADIEALLAPVLAVGGQAVLVTATLTKAVERLLAARLPAVRRCATASLHRAVAGARHRFVDVPGDSDKLDTLRTLLSAEAGATRPRTMVFCNTVPSCRAVEHALKESGLDTASYHGDMTPEARIASLKAFTAQLGQVAPPVLVCTDLAARGLDFGCSVGHVLMFDFPLNPVDYLHRTGRTARAGAGGRITSLVAKRDQVLAVQIEENIKKGGALDELSSSRAAVEAKKRATASARAPKPAWRGQGRPGQRPGAPAGGRAGPNQRGVRGAGRAAVAPGRPSGKPAAGAPKGRPSGPPKRAGAR